jgi:hypothetical protein
MEKAILPNGKSVRKDNKQYNKYMPSARCTSTWKYLKNKELK